MEAAQGGVLLPQSLITAIWLHSDLLWMEPALLSGRKGNRHSMVFLSTGKMPSGKGAYEPQLFFFRSCERRYPNPVLKNHSWAVLSVYLSKKMLPPRNLGSIYPLKELNAVMGVDPSFIPMKVVQWWSKKWSTSDCWSFFAWAQLFPGPRKMLRRVIRSPIWAKIVL